MLLDDFVSWSAKEFELLERSLAVLEATVDSAGDKPLPSKQEGRRRICSGQLARNWPAWSA